MSKGTALIGTDIHLATPDIPEGLGKCLQLCTG